MGRNAGSADAQPALPLRWGPTLPRVARGDRAVGARALAEMISVAIARAEALGADEVAGYLRMALLVAERRASEANR